MRQGANKSALAERGDDFYETPPCAVHALLGCNEPVLYPWPTEGRKPALWEPCAGRGAIARVLLDSGFMVTASDLVDRDEKLCPVDPFVDFLLEFKPPDVAGIVTNPPFKLADAFIRHGLGLGLPVLVLLRLMALEGEGRSDIVDRHLWRVWAGRERLPMMHRDNKAPDKANSSQMPFAWFVFLPEVRPGGQAIELRRISWRGPAA